MPAAKYWLKDTPGAISWVKTEPKTTISNSGSAKGEHRRPSRSRKNCLISVRSVATEPNRARSVDTPASADLVVVVPLMVEPPSPWVPK